MRGMHKRSVWPHLALSPLNDVQVVWTAVLGHNDSPLGHSLLAQAEQTARQQIARVVLEQISPFRSGRDPSTAFDP